MVYFKQVIICLSFIFVTQTLNAQSIEWFMQGNIGQTKAKFTDSAWKSNLSFQWNYTGGIRYHINDAISLESGISFISIKAERSLKIEITPEGNSSGLSGLDSIPYGAILGIPYERTGSGNEGPISNTFNFHIHQTSRYLGVPFSVLIKRKKIGFRSGIQTMFLLDSKETKNTFSLIPSPISDLRTVNESGTKYSVLFSQEDEVIDNNNYKNQSLSIGISYSFTSTKE